MKEFLQLVRKELEAICEVIKLKKADGEKLGQSDMTGSYEIDTGALQNAEPCKTYNSDVWELSPVITIRYYNTPDRNKLNAIIDETKAVLKVHFDKLAKRKKFTDFEIEEFSEIERENTEAKFEVKLIISQYIKHGA